MWRSYGARCSLCSCPARRLRAGLEGLRRRAALPGRRRPAQLHRHHQRLDPLSGDVSKISSITLKAARIEATDGKDVSFISGANISVSAANNILPTALIAKLAAPAPSGATSVELAITPRELKPYLQSNGTITAGIDYAPTPVTARALKLVLTIHGSLF